MSDIVQTRYGAWDRENDPCPGCGDGDKVPPGEAFQCSVCDAEWFEEDGDEDDQ
jgi:hypothetical protein